jgi:N-acetylneuraminic acid mutarotase
MISLFQREKQSPPSWSFSPRALVGLLLCGVACLTVTGTLPAFFHPEAQTQVSQRTLTFAERVGYQRTIEEVYWRHRIWPKENADPKPAFDAVMSQAQLENKVENYLRNSQALEDRWQKPITAEQLQAEIDRMARDTKQPEVVRELFEALGNDPAVIAECLARPTLAERLIAELSVQEQTWRFESSQSNTLRLMSLETASVQVAYTLPEIPDADSTCINDTWTATSTTNAPSARSDHTAVWTGSEMIVWGGENYYGFANGGGRYNPSTDSWTALSTAHAPGLSRHPAVWTGSEMIVWGGDANGPGTGGRYNPSTDSWTATSTTNAPFGREYHTAVWTGSEMIVWGGAGYYSPEYVYFNTGGRYNPRTDSWTATSTINVPTARSHHRAEWTGSEMIVWGGENGVSGFLNNGGRYDPSTNSWTATSTTNAPEARSHFTSVWTGSEMIVWGGYGDTIGSDGGRYNPSTNSWTATSTTNAPSPRSDHTAVWTGNEMIVWGDILTTAVADTILL